MVALVFTGVQSFICFRSNVIRVYSFLLCFHLQLNLFLDIWRNLWTGVIWYRISKGEKEYEQNNYKACYRICI